MHLNKLRESTHSAPSPDYTTERDVTPQPIATTRCGALFGLDCVRLMFHLPDASVDCVFADPPFNLGKDYGAGFSDRFSKSEYLTWCDLWIAECSRVLKPGGAFFIYALPELAYKFAGVMDRTLTFRHWIAMTMKGSFPRGRKLYPAHYALLYFTKGQPKAFNKVRLPIPHCRHCGGDLKDYGGHRKYLNPAGLNLTDFWEDTSPNRHKKSKFRKGINELKLTIPERAILISTDPGDIVFDPFGGGGTTFEAAEMNDRNWIGTEISTADAIEDRLKHRFPESFGQTPRFSVQDLLGTRVPRTLRLLETK